MPTPAEFPPATVPETARPGTSHVARPRRDSYPAAEVVALCAHVRGAIRGLAEIHPELTLVFDEFEEVVHHESDPLKEIGALFDACGEVFVQLKHLLNPTGLPLHLTDDGRVITQSFEGVTTFLTDIRGFTEMTRKVATTWNISVFDVLSDCYFPHVIEVLEAYGCHYLNYTGDGLLVLSKERRDDSGRVVLSSLDNAVLCAIAMTGVTNAIAEAWRRLGLTKADGNWHETGLGLSSGTVEVGDPFVPDRAPGGKCDEFDVLFRTIVAEFAPHFRPRGEYSRRVRAIQALSPSINRASRLQDTDKDAPAHTCMMTAEDVSRLCPTLRALFERVGTGMLRGLGEAEIYGIHRFGTYDLPALEGACLRHFADSSLEGSSP